MSNYQLPSRQTRGKRMRAALAEEEEEADNDFWNQDFFQEEQQDVNYATESEPEDVPDTDFDESESEDDDDEEAEVKEAPRRKALKPPGAAAAPRPRRPKAAPGVAEGQQEGEFPTPGSVLKQQKQRAPPEPAVFDMPSLRKTTLKRVAEAETLRAAAAEAKPRRRGPANDAPKSLTQEEMLAEAARTEVLNMASLRMLLAREEETKKKANMAKKHYLGPRIKMHSVGVLRPAPEVDLSGQTPQAGAGAGPAASAATSTAAAARAGQPSTSPAQPSTVDASGAGEGPGAAATGLAAIKAQEGAGPGAQAAAAGPGGMPGGPADPDGDTDALPPGTVREAIITLQPLNCKMLPRLLRPRRAPLPPPQAVCAATGQRARYRDPVTGQCSASLEAFQQLRLRSGKALPVPPPRMLAPQVAGQLSAHPGGVMFGLSVGMSVMPIQPALTEDVMASVLHFARQHADAMAAAG